MTPKQNKPIAAAYFYPGWHRDPARTIRNGTDEWELLYDDVARRVYPDVRRPLAGAVVPTVESLGAEAAAAMAGGIDAFLWCWYWDRGQLLLNRELEMFLQAKLPAGFQYALMWVNKRPHFSLPIDHMPPSWFDSRLVKTEEADFEAMIRHLIEHHWQRPEYIRLEDRPILPIFSVEPLIRQLGPRRLRAMLASGDRLAREAGLGGVYYVAIMHRLHARRRWLARLGLGRLAGLAPLASLGFSAVTNYLNLVDWDGPARQCYAQLVDKRIPEWPMYAEMYGLPFWPSVSPGWDARTRAVPRDPPPHAHPWSPLITDETPEQFARLVAACDDYAARADNVPIMPVASWNEWTEGHAVAPCDRHGDGMLNVLRSRKAQPAPSAARSAIASPAHAGTR